eukprot:UN02839
MFCWNFLLSFLLGYPNSIGSSAKARACEPYLRDTFCIQSCILPYHILRGFLRPSRTRNTSTRHTTFCSIFSIFSKF